MTEKQHPSSSGNFPLGEVIADWEGHADPMKPKNWPSGRKWNNVFLIALLTFVSPFGSSMLAPSMDQVMAEFGSTNSALQSLTVSIYVLGYAFGPLIFAPLSEEYGRQLPLLASSVLFLIMNIVCAVAVNLPMLIIFRFLTGLMGSAPLSLGPASIADMFEPQHCGKAMAAWNLPVLFAPAMGPLIGGYLTRAAGWRWNCWFMVIAMGVVLVAALFFLKESHDPTILERKARRMQAQFTNLVIRSALARTKSTQRTVLEALTRPTKLLLFSPIVQVLSLCSAVSYGFIYLLFTTLTEAFTRRYGIMNPESGLLYLGFGIGNIIGNLSLGVFSDQLVKHMTATNGRGEMKPEYRLPLLIPGTMLMPIGLLIYGWTLSANVHWIAPEIGLFVFGLGTIYISMPVSTYLVHAFPEHAASATAANTVLRSLLGGLLPLCGGRMYDALGDGWGNSLLAFISIAFIPPVLLLCRYGENLRKRSVGL
ncbi:major facilitator superfamily domain-containing protein [Aspergillus pseudoustus]|uniref:Major facilitator superfamily domain-containing protein n=1 Tax=Aspergillus pseudoustus TaxID=1810923 RepID=A0ABR4JBE1_9EURO